MSSPPANSPTILHEIEICPECGYLLHGLPNRTRCPECGFQPESDLIVLWGWSGAGSGNVATRRPALRTAHWVFLAAVILYCVRMLVLGNWWIPLIIALLVLPAAYSFYKIRAGRTHGKRPIQLRITPQGVAQREGFGPVAYKPWNPHQILTFSRTKPGGLRILCDRPLRTQTFCNFETDLDMANEAALKNTLSGWICAAGGQVLFGAREKTSHPPSPQPSVLSTQSSALSPQHSVLSPQHSLTPAPPK